MSLKLRIKKINELLHKHGIFQQDMQLSFHDKYQKRVFQHVQQL